MNTDLLLKRVEKLRIDWSAETDPIKKQFIERQGKFLNMIIKKNSQGQGKIQLFIPKELTKEAEEAFGVKVE